MKRTFILFLFLITNLFNTHGQTGFLPSSLNDHDHNVWLTTIDESNIASNTFQQLKTLNPCDPICIESRMSGDFPFTMQIFTFSDSLRIQTYDAENKQLIKTECYKYKRRLFEDSYYIVYMDSYKIKIIPQTAYGYFYNIDIEFDGLPALNDPEYNVWIGEVPANLLSCDSTEKEFILSPYNQNIAEEFSINKYIFSDKKIQIFTFGDSLRVQTLQWFGGKILETEFYSYEQIENEPSSFWVYLPNCKVKFKAGSAKKSQYEITILHE